MASSKSCFMQAVLLILRNTTSFTINHLQEVTKRRYKNCSAYCPPCSVLSTVANIMLNAPDNKETG